MDGMESPKFRFEAGDVLYSKLRPNLRKAVIAPFAGLCSADMYPLTPRAEKVTPKYLLGLLLSDDFTEFALENSARARMPKLNRADLFRFRHAFPPLPEQASASDIDTQLAHIDTARQAAERRVKAAEGLEAALFREAFHGVVPVVIGAPQEAAPPGWSWQRLATLARLESGHTPSRKHTEWWGGDIPWIALPDIRALDGKVAMETKASTNPEGIKNSSARILPKDTVVFGRDVQVGFTTIMGRPMATSQHFFNWLCGEQLAPRFLMHALRASKTYMETQSSGAIHQTIYMPAAREFQVCLPDRPAQDALAARLDEQLAAAATVLASARAELKAIDALPAAVLRRVFEPEYSASPKIRNINDY
jgi:type I restriction enzyme S subunit